MLKYIIIGIFTPLLLSYEIQLNPNTFILNTVQGTPVYKQIKRVKPDIEANYAAHLTKSIYEVAKAFKMDPKLLTAILAQESKFQPKAYNPVSKDYSIAQINYKTAKLYHFDIDRLNSDVKYSIQAEAIVLQGFRRVYGQKEKDYWTRYNSSIPEKRKEYKSLVVRYM